MKNPSRHTEWLSLIEISGPFITVSVLEKAFPQGLEAIETPRRQKLRAAYDEWREAVDEDDRLLSELHREWIRLVLTEMLEYDDESLVPSSEWKGEPLAVSSPEHAGSFSPDWIVRSPGGDKPRVFISVQAPNTDFESIQRGDSWPVSLQERMTLLCRAHSVRLGLLTNGERWMLINAPTGSTSSHISWYARLWFQEPITLKAFQSLLGVRRCFGPTDETLEALLEESLKHHEEVTDTLGEQVRRAVEVLVQCLDKADADRNRELLRDMRPGELYEAGLTIMMRLVFVLCAEERGLLLSGDPIYDQNYAVSTMRGQLAEESRLHGPEVLERRHDAWARLLAVFRAVHGGIEHESLRMPALGGSLFDPDRFPFLEGRAMGTHRPENYAAPLPVDNRTVLLLLNSLQILEQSGGALLLSYRALDVEQIGHVYEGLLEHTVARVPSTTLGLVGTQKIKNPNIALADLESVRLDGEAALTKLVTEVTGRSESAIRNSLSRSIDETLFGRILGVCGGDMDLATRIRPFANLLRTDAWEDPIVYRENAFIVTLGADRRETGTHYTPKSLTESIVTTTLEPLVYIGPSAGNPREEWALRASWELLELKVCDPAMGSGAFLVQACRYLGEKLVEAWLREEADGKTITVDGEAKNELGASEPMPSSLDERLTIARRLVAERCLYGVDINPLAVELAKLAIWLVTMAKGRPFGFLDHNLRHGDSLLGIHRLDQLTHLSMKPDSDQHQFRIFGQNIEHAVKEAIELRKRLRSIPIRDIMDVAFMARLDQEARRKLESIELIADAMIGEALRCGGNTRALDTALDSLATLACDYLNGNEKLGEQIVSKAKNALSLDLPEGKPPRRPFHWVLEFPEVFATRGFEGVVGNPPFLGGKRITSALGVAYERYLKVHSAGQKGAADLCAYFFLKADSILMDGGCFGFLATNSISQTETRAIGLDRICKRASIYSTFPSLAWPGNAAVHIAIVNIYKGHWAGLCRINGRMVTTINSHLQDSAILPSAKKLLENKRMFFGTKGTYVHGKGFVINKDLLEKFISCDHRNREVIKPYLIAKDFTTDPQHIPSRWVIDFGNMSELEARSYKEPFLHLEKNVRPHREKLTGQIHEVCFWKFWDKREELYCKISYLKHVLICPEVSKYSVFALVPNEYVFSSMVNVVASESPAVLACLQSHIHETWAWHQGSTMKSDLRYTTKDCLDTFPFPLKLSMLDEIGLRFHLERSEFMRKNNEGLTKTYNRLHDQSLSTQDVRYLRALHIQLDQAVMDCYGWHDLKLEHGFHQTPRGVRFTFSEDACREVLQRLLELNHERYEEEIRHGLHDKELAKKSSGSDCGKKSTRESHAPNLFDSSQSNTGISVNDFENAVLQFLKTNEGWFGKDDILSGCGISPDRWPTTIKRLLEEGVVECQGERSSRQYRAKRLANG